MLIVTVAAVVFLIVHAESRGVSNRRGVDIYVNSNGIPTFLGIQLGNGFVFDLTLRTLHRCKVPVRVLTPSGRGWYPGWDTNWTKTMEVVIKALSIPTNQPSTPSPYE